jgi:hypothetical protein
MFFYSWGDDQSYQSLELAVSRVLYKKFINEVYFLLQNRLGTIVEWNACYGYDSLNP